MKTKINRRGSWYKFVFSKEDLDTPGDPGSHIRYNGRRLTNMEFSDHWGKCVMCVYCDDRERDEVLKISTQFGIKMKAWSYEREVIEKWLPGGNDEILLEAGDVNECIDKLKQKYSDTKGKFRDENRLLLDSINIYINGDNILNLKGLETALQKGDEVDFMSGFVAG